MISDVVEHILVYFLRYYNITTFLFIIIGIYVDVQHYKEMEKNMDKYTYSECGTLLDKKQSPSSGDFINYFWVRYDDNEVKKIKVTDNTYFNNKKNSRICFTKHTDEYQHENNMLIWRPLIPLILWIIGICILFSDEY